MQFNKGEKGCILTMVTDKVTSGGWRGYIYLVVWLFPSELYSSVHVIEFCIPLRPILSYSSEKCYQNSQTFILICNLQKNLFFMSTAAQLNVMGFYYANHCLVGVVLTPMKVQSECQHLTVFSGVHLSLTTTITKN